MREVKMVKMKYKGKEPVHIGGMLRIVILKKGDVYDMPEIMSRNFLEKRPKDWEVVPEKSETKTGKAKGGK